MHVVDEPIFGPGGGALDFLASALVSFGAWYLGKCPIKGLKLRDPTGVKRLEHRFFFPPVVLFNLPLPLYQSRSLAGTWRTKSHDGLKPTLKGCVCTMCCTHDIPGAARLLQSLNISHLSLSLPEGLLNDSTLHHSRIADIFPELETSGQRSWGQLHRVLIVGLPLTSLSGSRHSLRISYKR